MIDPEGIHRAVLNIVTNAIDACEGAESAQVSIKTEWDAEAPLARITVSDNGVGIDEAEIPSIFQIFASTKGSRGTGLGLPVSQKIIREHGGKISVTSRPGQGATFLIELPVTKRGRPEGHLGRAHDRSNAHQCRSTVGLLWLCWAPALPPPSASSVFDLLRRVQLLLCLPELVEDALRRADDEHAVANAVGQPQLLEHEPKRRLERNALEIQLLTVEVMVLSASLRPSGRRRSGCPRMSSVVVACLMYFKTSSSGVSSLKRHRDRLFEFLEHRPCSCGFLSRMRQFRRGRQRCAQR